MIIFLILKAIQIFIFIVIFLLSTQNISIQTKFVKVFNVLDYESNKKVQHFLSSMFQYNMIPTINKPTRVTRNTATAIDHIITNTVISGIQHRSGIIKTDISDNFPIVKKVSQKIRHDIFINASTKKSK